MYLGNGRRPVLAKDIQLAQEMTKSGAEAARFLHISYNTYKRYAQFYGLFEKHRNEHGKGIRRVRKAGGFGLDSILAGEHPYYSLTKLKERLVRAGYLKQECALCGFNQVRTIDGRTPLVLQQLDGNRLNFSLDNLQLRCYNCTYLTTGRVTAKAELDPGFHSQDILSQISLDEIHALQDELMVDDNE